MSNVIVQKERRRGCGFRKPAKDGVGIYLVANGLAAPCGRLPFELAECPCCSGGFKPTRSWSWITPQLLFGKPPQRCDTNVRQLPVARRGFAGTVDCERCVLGGQIPAGKHGLHWIGGSFYKTPGEFTREAKEMGISRKLSALPKGFKLGETWVFLAHREAYFDPQRQVMVRAIFSAFKPTGVDLVIEDENVVPEKARRIQEQLGDGCRIIKVIPEDETLFSASDTAAEVAS